MSRSFLQDRVNQPADKLQQSGGSNPGGAHPKQVAALQARNRRKSGGGLGIGFLPGSPGTGQRRDVSNMSFGSVAGPQLVVEIDKYHEMMKLTTDNKINSANAWSLALIDYFVDMSLLRNTDDHSINFQKASATLDGCVKIWTSRVDSVATETGKLLSGLAEDGRYAGDDEGENGENDDDDDETIARKNKRKAARQAATLADSFSKIKVKALELEFTVDPLFKKTSADFDEGGAGGILMNHLGCDGNMKVVFDAGDAKLEDADGDEAEDEEEEGRFIDLSKLQAKHIPHLDDLLHMSLCPSFADFRFSEEANLDLGIVNPIDDEMPLPSTSAAANRSNPDSTANATGEFSGFDATGGDPFVNDDYGGGGDDNDDDDLGGAGDMFDPLAFDNEGASGAAHGGEGGEGDYSNHNSTGTRAEMVGINEDMYDAFDNTIGKNWVGPEHWKMRRVLRKPADESTATTAKQRKEKTAFALDFSQPPLISQKELFASATPASIRNARKSSLPASSRSRRSSRPQAKEDAFILPDDFHFNSSLLLRLFLKPKATLKMRRRILVDGEPDAQFWAPGGGQNDGNDDDLGGMGDQDFFGDDGPAPFNTQFIMGDDDDNEEYGPQFEDPEGLDAAEDQDLMAATQGQLLRVRPENVSYAKRAKRVDVKKLKDTIWKELEEVTIPVKELPSESSYDLDASSAAPESLIPVISGLRRVYPQDKMDEISTSFCFICLLHLANEKGLRIQTPNMDQGGDENWDEPVLKVGGLQGLRVLREVVA